MPKVFTSPTQKIGQLGEDIAVETLEGQGFIILERNVTRRYSEIDLVAEREGVIYCIEVKTARKGSRIRPEENMTTAKLHKLRRGVEQLRQSPRYVGREVQVDLVTVVIDQVAGTADVERFPRVL